MKKIAIGVLLYTHERVDDARINMDIIRSLWREAGLFSDITIVHAYNGNRQWYPRKYKEDVLLRIKNHGHFRGAAELMDVGVRAFSRYRLKHQYVIILAADTWCVKPQYLRTVISAMQKEHKVWATCPWGLPARYHKDQVGMATDFHIVDVQWARRYGFFPLRYYDFWKRYHEIVSYLHPGSNVSAERLALARFYDASFRQYINNVQRKEMATRQIYLLKERMPVHIGKDKMGYWIRRFYWPRIGLLTHHQPAEKQKALRAARHLHGSAVEQFLKSKHFEYYNLGNTIRRSYN